MSNSTFQFVQLYLASFVCYIFSYLHVQSNLIPSVCLTNSLICYYYDHGCEEFEIFSYTFFIV